MNSETALKAGVFSFSAKPVTPEAGVVGPWPLPPASRFQAPSTPWPESLLQSFLWPHDIPIHGEMALCLLVRQFIDVQVVSMFWPLWVMLL